MLAMPCIMFDNQFIINLISKFLIFADKQTVSQQISGVAPYRNFSQNQLLHPKIDVKAK